MAFSILLDLWMTLCQTIFLDEVSYTDNIVAHIQIIFLL